MSHGNQTEKAFLAIKFRPDMRNREKIEGLADAVEDAGYDTTVIIRDYEDWGEKTFKPEELMRHALDELESADLLIVDLTEKGVGLGIEAGYAHAHNIPILVVAEQGSDISTTLQGIATDTFLYDTPEQITAFLSRTQPYA